MIIPIVIFLLYNNTGYYYFHFLELKKPTTLNSSVSSGFYIREVNNSI
jgi:hypothetical protein